MSLLPIFLKLEGRRTLLVGAGSVALTKIGSLLETGARLTVVAPEAGPEVRRLAAAGRLELVERAFEAGDLAGAFLVIAATNRPEVNAAVHRAAVARGIPSNSVDDIPNSEFFFGSVVRRGPLAIAVSTGGESPALAQRLAREIEAQLPADLGPWLEQLGELRREVLASHPSGEPRRLLLHRLAQRELCSLADCPARLSARAPAPALAPDRDRDDTNSPTDKGGSGAGVAGERPARGRAYLVGAGPGDPDLLTVRALRLIQTAELILHDDLVPGEILGLAPAAAEVVNVGKRCGREGISQEEINALMVAQARRGRRVIRLKSGDPLVFGRAAEEMAALSRAGVDLEVVPGVTAALAAAAQVPLSLTSRGSASSLVFSTGHHASSHRHTQTPKLEDATRVVYMPGRDLRMLALEWLGEGLPPGLPCVVVARAGQPGQQIRCTTLGELGELEPLPAPSVLIAGWAVRESTGVPADAPESASAHA